MRIVGTSNSQTYSCPNHTKLSVQFQAMKFLEIMLRNRCWSTTFHTITIGDVDEWC